MRNINEDLFKIITISKVLGLSENDLKNAIDYLNHNELELCLDTIITQFYEYDLKIDKEFYELIEKVANKMKLNQDQFIFMKELINPAI